MLLSLFLIVKVSKTGFFVRLICNAYCENKIADPYADDTAFAFSRLSPEVQSDLNKISSGAIKAVGGSCLGIETVYDQVELLLYTNNTDNSTKLDTETPVGIDFTTPLFLLTHGWLSGTNGYKIKPFRDKYIELYGKNIIFVNWGGLAWHSYSTVYCNIPSMAQHIATFLCKLSEDYDYDLNLVHMIGHSFGGQLSGFTGKATQRICKKTIGKITALDPAGPIYQFLPALLRLSPTDASFVEVVHSASGTFGYQGKCGTVDYHLNCGVKQPGCLLPSDFGDNVESSFFAVACHHFRALEIWSYVIELEEFKAKSCAFCPALVPGTCVTDMLKANYISMGHTYSKPRSNHYNVVTGAEPPFRLGCAPYRSKACI